MFVLLQIYPPEAAAEDGSDDNCCLDVLAVDPSEVALECYLAAYKRRYRAACQAFDAWDDQVGDWGPEHSHTHRQLLDRYQVYGSLITGTRFKILECRDRRAPTPARAA